MSNKMKKVAKLLGVELEEEFEVYEYPHIHLSKGKFKFTKDGLWSVEKGAWDYFNSLELHYLLVGALRIKKLPFEPKMNENYWTYTHDDFKVFQSYWLDSAIDYARKKCGMIFRTEEEAKRERQRVYEELTGKKWEELNNASN